MQLTSTAADRATAQKNAVCRIPSPLYFRQGDALDQLLVEPEKQQHRRQQGQEHAGQLGRGVLGPHIGQAHGQGVLDRVYVGAQDTT